MAKTTYKKTLQAEPGRAQNIVYSGKYCRYKWTKDDFIIGKKLGEGQYGNVFLAK